MKKQDYKEIDCEKIGSILSSEAVRDIYEMAKLNVDKTVQRHDAIISKATVLIGLLATVLMAFISAAYAIIKMDNPDITAIHCIGIAIIITATSLFLLIFGVISGKRICTTGETADKYTDDEILEWYKSIPEDSRDNAYILFKADALSSRTDYNMKVLYKISKCYNWAIRLFICALAAIGVVYTCLILSA